MWVLRDKGINCGGQEMMQDSKGWNFGERGNSLSGNVVEVRRKSDRVMAIVLTLDREVMLVICAYGPQSGRPDTAKVHFYGEMRSEWDLGSSSEIIVSLGDFNGHVE